MTKKITALCAVLSLFLTSSAQDFSGYRNGNYTGVNGVFFNPANFADSRYKFDFNLFSISAFVGNNQAKFSLSDLNNSFNGDSIKNQLFGDRAGKSSGLVNTTVHGPSLMFNAGKKMAIALTTKARVMANVADMDGKLANTIMDDFNNDPSLPYTISSPEDMRFTVNGWTEFGLSLSRILSDRGENFFKGGLTLKYLAGAGNGYFNLAGFKGTLNDDLVRQDVYLANATGGIAVGFGGIRIAGFEAEDLLKMKSTGIGADIGFVYEFRPEYEKYSDGNGSRGQNKYKFKVGMALLDLGKISYQRDLQRSGSYNIDITGNERLYLSELDGVDVDDYKTFFNSRPQFFTAEAAGNESNYKVALPSTLQLDLDYHLHKNTYVSLASQFSLAGKSNIFNTYYYNTFTLTPRYEGKGIGLYIPINYNTLTKFNAGASFRFGPLFVGSGSVLTALFGSSKQVDVHMGLRFGLLR